MTMTMTMNPDPAMTETSVIDSSHPDIRRSLDRTLAGKGGDEKSRAVAIYYAVRDGVSYEVFGADLGPEALRGSAVLKSGKGFCLHKAILFATMCRAAGIPCRIASAPVRNHISSPNLSKLVGGEIFLHWFNEVWLEGRWIKVAPIFNKLLCRIYQIPPLEFDGTGDAFVQGHVEQSEMEYLDTPQIFEAPTAEELIALVAAHHPLMVSADRRVPRERDIIAK